MCFSLISLGWITRIAITRSVDRNLEIEKVTWNFASGISVVTLIVFTAAKLDANITITSQIVALISGLPIFLRFSRKIDLRTLKRHIWVLISCAVGIWQFIPGIYTARNADPLGTMVVKTNNDIANYAAIASEFLQSGFRSSGHIANIDLNFFSLHGAYQVPNILISYVSANTRIETWQITTPVMGVAVTFSILGIACLAKSINSKLRDSQAIVIAIFVMCSAFMTYIQINYFLGQVLCIGITALLLANLMDFIYRSKMLKASSVNLFFLTVLSIFSYPHFLLPYLGFMVLNGILYCFVHKRNFKLRMFFHASIPIVLALSVSSHYLQVAINLGFTQTSVIAGWSLPFPNPISAFLLPPLIGQVTPVLVLVFSWLLFLTLSIQIIGIRQDVTFARRIFYIYLYLSHILFFLAAVILTGRSFEDYGSWKLMSYLLPIVLTIPLAVIYSKIPPGGTFSKVVVSIVLMISPLSWFSPNSIKPSFISTELIEAARDPRISGLKSLNVQLNPYFETMAFAAMIDGPVLYFNSDSYWAPVSDRDSCTLVRLATSGYKHVTEINSTFGLASSSPTSCRQLGPAIEPKTKTKFDLKNRVFQTSGFAASESWGTWTTDGVAKIVFDVDFDDLVQGYVSIENSAFLYGAHRELVSQVFINSVLVGEITHKIGEPVKISKFKIPEKAKAEGVDKLEVTLLIANPKSPLETGFSSDPRKLGLGIISLEIH